VAPEQLKYNLLQEDDATQAEVISVSQLLEYKASQKTRITSPQTHKGIPNNFTKLLSMGDLPTKKFQNFRTHEILFLVPPR